MAADNQISLREYVDVRFEAQEKAVAAALASADRAVAKAESATEKRFESVNEFRAALSDSSRLLMPRSEAEISNKVLSEKIEVLTARLNAKDEQGRGMGQGWIILVAVVSMIGTIAMLVFRARG